MITLRRNGQRHHHDRRSKGEGWLTFYSPDRADPLADGFGALETLNEDLLAPSASVGHSHHDAEVVTYVREGALAYEDSMGRSGVISAGEFHRMSVGRGIRHTETNPLRGDSAQVFQIGLRSSAAGRATGHEQRRFSAAERRGALCLVASPDARGGSLLVQQDALIYSAMLTQGQHVVHALVPGRSAWLHLVRGRVTLGDLVLTTGDGAGITAERAVSVTAWEETEILLVDLLQFA